MYIDTWAFYIFLVCAKNTWTVMKREWDKTAKNTVLTFSFYFCLKMIGGNKPMLENRFKQNLVKELEILFPGCIVIHLDPTEYQGIPDLLILYENKWAALEGKKSRNEHRQPNQKYYVDLMNQMSFSRFIYPENKEEVLYELQQAFKS